MFYTGLTPFGVDMGRLIAQRLARLQDAMKRQGLAGLLLTDPLNIRYATNTVFMPNLRAAADQSFALVAVEGSPWICQRETAMRTRHRVRGFDAYMFAMRPAVATGDFVAEVVAGLRGGDPEEYLVALGENMIIALEINRNPVKLEHLLRVAENGAEFLSPYPLDPDLVPA